MKLQERAMTLNLVIGHWQGYRLDKEASRDVTDRAGADTDAARVNKHLIPKDLLAPIQSAAGAVRNHFYAKTLPWRDNGDRLITRTMFQDYIQEHEVLAAAFHEAVRVFLDERYLQAIDTASFRMGELFNRDDYPQVSQLRHKFYLQLDFDVITAAGDFRVSMGKEHEDLVMQSMERQAEERVQRAMASVWERMAKTVSYLADRMENVDSNFRQSTLDSIDQMVDLIPGINLLDDPNIEAMRLEIKAKLGGLDRAALKENVAVRKQIGAEARGIMENMKSYMNAFGNSGDV